jgi:hypothetical protein
MFYQGMMIANQSTDLEYIGDKDASGALVHFTLHNLSHSDLNISVGAEMKIGEKISAVTDDIFSKSYSKSKLNIEIKAGEADTLVWDPANIMLLNPQTFKSEGIRNGNLRLVFYYGEALNDKYKSFKTDFFFWHKK